MAFIKLRHVGNTLHCYQYEKFPIVERRSKKPSFYQLYPELKWLRETKGRLVRNIGRTKKNFVELVRANLVKGDPALLTLTFSSVVGITDGYRSLTAFFVTLRRLGYSLSYVGVPEFQKRGSVHFHLLVWGLPRGIVPVGHWSYLGRRKIFVHDCSPRQRCERLTRKLANTWGHGYVDVVPTDGSPKLAGYLAKYMSKTMSDVRLSGRKAFTSSRNCLRPVSVSNFKDPVSTAFLLRQFGLNEEDIGSVDNPIAISERQFYTDFLGRGLYKRYSISGYD